VKSSTGRKSTLAVLTLVLLSFFIFTGCTNLFNKPPVWVNIPDQTTDIGKTVTLDLKNYVVDPEGALKSITLKSGPGQVSDGVYTWTPTKEGTYEVTIVAEDNAGAKAEKTFKILVGNQAPVWQTIPDQQVVTPKSVTVDLTKYVTDPEGSPLTIMKESGPGTVENGKYLWTTTMQTSAGTYKITVAATDDVNNISRQSFNVIVKANQAPVWQAVPDLEVVKGKNVSIDLKTLVTDPENTKVTISLKSGPGQIVDGVYTWQTSLSDLGLYTVKVAAKDEDGMTSELSLKVYVRNSMSTTFTAYVSEFNSGPVVQGVNVTVKDADGTVRGSGTTDANGKASISVTMYSSKEELNVFFSKSGYARTTILGLKLNNDEPYTLSTTLRKATVGETTKEIPIDVDVKVYTDNTKTTEANINNMTLDSIYVVVTATPTEFKEGINLIYAKANGIPGTSFFAGQRLYVSGASKLEGYISVKEFNGTIPLVVDVYDHNDNKVEKLIWINVKRNIPAVTPYEVEKYTSRYTTSYDLLAYTRRSPVEFYSKPPIEKNVTAANPVDKVNGAPADTNLWVEVRWLPFANSTQATSRTAPKSYNLYRSFDGINYDLIATTSAMPYRDSSPLLEVGKETWYAVSAVYDGYEAPMTIIGSIIPLPMVQIEYTGPINSATNVSRDPTFGWTYKGLEAYTPAVGDTTKTLMYIWDIWLYDEIVNDYGYYSLGYVSKGNAYYYNFTSNVPQVQFKFSDFYYVNSYEDYGFYWVDFGIAKPYAYDKLQANKTYCWGNELLAAQLEYNGLSQEDPTKKFKSISYSVHTDLAPNLTPYAIDPEVYNTFTTGSN